MATKSKRGKNPIISAAWKIVVGLIFLAVPFGAGNDFGVGEFLVAWVIGMAFIAWAIIPIIKRRTAKKANAVPAERIPAAPLETPAPATSAEIPKATPVYRKDQVVGIPLAYNYVLPFEPTGADIGGRSEIEAGVQVSGEDLEYWSGGVLIGRTHDASKARMAQDFAQAGEPCLAYVMPAKGKVNLRFYRDRRKGQDWREQTVVTLTGYKGRDAQEILSCLTPGQPLELDEDVDPGAVWCHGVQVGKLPAKARQRAEEDEIYGLFVESVEYAEVETNDGEDILEVYTPHIRIYW